MVKKEYEIVSHDTLDDLRSELSRLKGEQKYEQEKDPTGLMTGMNELSGQLHHFTSMLTQLAQNLELEEKEEKFLGDQLEPMSKRLHVKMDQILAQNEQIAKGIVTIADMLRDQQQPMYTPPMRQAPPPMRQSPPPMMQPPAPMRQTPPMPSPPPPNLNKKKFGLF